MTQTPIVETEILQQTTLILNLLTMCEFLVYFSRQFAWNKPELFHLLVGRVDGWLSLCHFQPLLYEEQQVQFSANRVHFPVLRRIKKYYMMLPRVQK